MQLLTNTLYYIQHLNILGSNAMVVDTTCMQAVGLADPPAGAYGLEIISTVLWVGSHCQMQMSATASVNSSVLNILSCDTECLCEHKITLRLSTSQQLRLGGKPTRRPIKPT